MSILQEGFFQWDSTNAKSAIIAKLMDQPYVDRDKLIAYLDAGQKIVALAQIATDFVSEDESTISPLEILTDGVWAWTSDVVFYVKKYNYMPDHDFIMHMRRQNWIPSPVSRRRSQEIAAAIFST